jgi:NAD-dependent SIR2 family protein deacetylase
MKEKKKVEKCIDCNEKTDNFYVYSINKGKIIRCASCHELNIIRSVKFDTRIFSEQHLTDLTREL